MVPRLGPSRASQLGLELVETSGDGNCLFRAVSIGMLGEEESHGNFRRVVEDTPPVLRQELGGGDIFEQVAGRMGSWVGSSQFLRCAGVLV